MENQPNQAPQVGNKALWIVLIIVILAIAGYAVYAYVTGNTNNANNANTNGNSNQTVNTNTASNTNSAVNANSNVNSVANANTNSTTNTNINTSGWKTYHDEKYQFSVKYPPSWTYQLYTTGYNDEGPYVIAFTSDRPSPQFISVREDWSVAKEVDKINKSDPPYTKVTKEEDINIGSLSVVKITYDTSIGLTFTKTIIVRDSIAYMFNSWLGDSEFEPIVSSFTTSS